MSEGKLKRKSWSRQMAGCLTIGLGYCLANSHRFVVIALAAPLYTVHILLSNEYKRYRKTQNSLPSKGALSLPSFVKVRLTTYHQFLQYLFKKTRIAPTILGLEKWESTQLDSKNGNSIPIVLLGCHQGVVDWMFQAIPVYGGRRFTVITAPAFAQNVTTFMTQARKSPYHDFFVQGDSSPFLLRKALQCGDVVGFLIDNNPQEDGTLVEFSPGLAVPVPMKLLLWAQKQGAHFFTVHWTDAHCNFLQLTELKSNQVIWDEKKWESKLSHFMRECVARAPQLWNWGYPKISDNQQVIIPRHRRASGKT